MAHAAADRQTVMCVLDPHVNCVAASSVVGAIGLEPVFVRPFAGVADHHQNSLPAPPFQTVELRDEPIAFVLEFGALPAQLWAVMRALEEVGADARPPQEWIQPAVSAAGDAISSRAVALQRATGDPHAKRNVVRSSPERFFHTAARRLWAVNAR
jgi:hypothetical protein